MYEVKKSGLRASHVYDFVKTWKWPRRLGSKGQCGVEMFGPKRAASNWEAQSWKCSQSEALSIHAPLAHWFREVVLPTGAHNAACDAMMSLSALIHILWHHAKLQIPAGAVLSACEKYVHCYRVAFGPEWMLWKHHALLHHAGIVARFGFTPNTLALERKHKQILKFGEDHQHDCRGVLKNVVSQCLHNLEHAPWLNMALGLVSPRTPPKKMNEFLQNSCGESVYEVSGKARFSQHDVCWESDIVALRVDDGWRVARVLFLAKADGVEFAAVQFYECSDMSQWHSTWKRHGLPQLVDLFSFLEVLVYRGGSNEIQVLHPIALVR